ncbi:hypothetical protein JXB41_04400 [Candidatus Woesearchaeota archaeon]|nr:hypothetical protein [Candidatus Woesearchaeota archaeon]
MIKITQQEFNKELDRYLSTKVRKGALKKKAESEIIASDSDFEKESQEFCKEREPFYRRIFNIFMPKKQAEIIRETENGEELDSFQEQTEESKEEEEIKPKKEKDIISKILDFFRFTHDEYEEFPAEEYKEQPVLDEDIKKVIKIQHKWINQLTKEKIKEFKKSEDFETYKEVLSKYNLIK